jgi:hypothetical protein
MDNPVKQTGTLDSLDQFGITFEGLIPTEAGWAIGFRCGTCGALWTAMRSSETFQKEATECPRAQTSKKHLAKDKKST